MSAAGFSFGICCNTVPLQTHDDGAIAGHDDYHWKDEGEECHGQTQAEEEGRGVVFHTWQFISSHHHFFVDQGWDAQYQGGHPHHNAGQLDGPAVPQELGVQQLHHSQVAVHTHAGEEEDVGEAVHSDDVAAQLTQQVPDWAKIPGVVTAGRKRPQWQRDDKYEVGQGQVEDERVHQTSASLPAAAHHQDDKQVAKKAREKNYVIEDGQENVGAWKIGAGTAQWDIEVQEVVVTVIVVIVIITGHPEQRGSAVWLQVSLCSSYLILHVKATEKNSCTISSLPLSSPHSLPLTAKTPPHCHLISAANENFNYSFSIISQLEACNDDI